MIGRRTWAIVAASIVCISATGGALLLLRMGGHEPHVSGGMIVSNAQGVLEVRCLSSTVTLQPKGFTGRIVFANCFPGSELTGYSGTLERNGTTLSFDVLDQETVLTLSAPAKESFSFAVLGDSQGHNDILRSALDQINGTDFLIHCGDLTPSGTGAEFAAVERVLNSSRVPVFTTPGNHDAKNGLVDYGLRFGPSEYSFTYSGVTFAFVDSSDLDVSSAEVDWMRDAFSDSAESVIITHAPSYDPFEGNHTLNGPSCDRIQAFAQEASVDMVFSGHVHAYSEFELNGTNYVITGGSGGSLTAGVFHYTKVNVADGKFDIMNVPIQRNSTVPGTLKLTGPSGTVNLTADDLQLITHVQGVSSYENQFGNVGGSGTYEGIPFSELLKLVGNMTEQQTVKVVSSDGYCQEFGFLNVYPNASWLLTQGQMILALSYNGVSVPDWQDGPRIAMLSQDGLYSNSDCSLTSYPGQGYDLYASAGARWSKNVVSIEVE